jgi:hypothetical protein
MQRLLAARGRALSRPLRQAHGFAFAQTDVLSPKTPTDNASCESWMATLKCERPYDPDTEQIGAMGSGRDDRPVHRLVTICG